MMPLFALNESIVVQSGTRTRWMRSTGLRGSSATPRDMCAASIGADATRHNVTALLKELQWPSLADRRRIARLTLFYNAPTGKISITLCNLLDRSDSRTRGAQNNYKYICTKNTAFGQSFFPKTLKDWNKIGNETKNPLSP